MILNDNTFYFSHSKPLFKNPYSNFYNQYYQYTLNLQRNTAILKQRFPYQNIKKIKLLLQQFDNSKDKVYEVLEKQQKIIQNQLETINQINNIEYKQNIYKKAFLKCFKKKMQAQISNAQKDQEIERLKRQNEQLKAKIEALYKMNKQDQQLKIMKRQKALKTITQNYELVMEESSDFENIQDYRMKKYYLALMNDKMKIKNKYRF